ncbi:hypothetical protein RQP54_13925 [Curvibacter sp. APW13]|uniref:hypothetical protein n=1 Tax=Curvibacter sp. APW13 TaxID=3077236 RepID=UPI0028DE72D7|nr:hypothetical protein [Curvibacter sp. APW13]MDT8991965.1 hypothetical protein [Curvibacter sp. APW13]
MTRWIRWVGLLALVCGLWGCAASVGSVQSVAPSANASTAGTSQVKAGVAPIPGGYWMYSYGPGQTYANWANVELAQYDYALWAGRRWRDMGAQGRASANKLGLQAYYPLHVRWKLKDGREFILENIDTAAVMREYFKTHQLQLQWQRERRPRDGLGDYEPLLAHEVKDNTVILKWVITINRTPVNERTGPDGKTKPWDTYDEEHIVAVLPGNPTSGIDFTKP